MPGEAVDGWAVSVTEASKGGRVSGVVGSEMARPFRPTIGDSDGMAAGAGESLAAQTGPLLHACDQEVAALIQTLRRPTAASVTENRSETRSGAEASVRIMSSPGPRTLVLVGPGEQTRRHAAGAWGTLAGYGAEVEAPREHDEATVPELPLSLTIGRWLLDRAGVNRRAGENQRADRNWQVGETQRAGENQRADSNRQAGENRGAGENRQAGESWRAGENERADENEPPTRLIVQEVSAAASPDECLRLGRELAQEAGPDAAWLVLGDGSNRRGIRSPGFEDPRASAFDAEVAGALGALDPERLAAIDPTLAVELGCRGRVAWQVAAGALRSTGAGGDDVGTGAGGDDVGTGAGSDDTRTGAGSDDTGTGAGGDDAGAGAGSDDTGAGAGTAVGAAAGTATGTGSSTGRSTLRYEGAPFGVAYLVAGWDFRA